MSGTRIKLNRDQAVLVRNTWQAQAFGTKTELQMIADASPGKGYTVRLQAVELRILIATLETYLAVATAFHNAPNYPGRVHRLLKLLNDAYKGLPECACGCGVR